MVSCDFRRVIETSDKEAVRPLKTLTPADTDVFKTSSGGFKKIMTSYNQTKRFLDVWQKTSELQRQIYVALKKSDLLRLEDIWFTTSWRRLIYNVLKTSDLGRLENVQFPTSWRRLI